MTAQAIGARFQCPDFRLGGGSLSVPELEPSAADHNCPQVDLPMNVSVGAPVWGVSTPPRAPPAVLQGWVGFDEKRYTITTEMAADFELDFGQQIFDASLRQRF